MTTLRAHLSEQIQRTQWDALQPHHARQALIFVDTRFDLVEVALAVATDQSAVVHAWIQHGHLGRPSDALVEAWAHDNATFQFVIAQPFVLIQGPLLPQPPPSEDN